MIDVKVYCSFKLLYSTVLGYEGNKIIMFHVDLNILLTLTKISLRYRKRKVWNNMYLLYLD